MEATDALSKALPGLPPTNIPELLERALRPYIESGLAGTLTASQAAELIDGEAIAKGQRDLASLPLDRLRPLMRTVFTSHATWALFTVEYLDSLQRLLRILCSSEDDAGKEVDVLEVCAGRGCLTLPMRQRGFHWTATDAQPPSAAMAAGTVSQCGALQALQDCGAAAPSVLFWAWWSKPKAGKKKRKAANDDDAALAAERNQVDEDRALAEELARRRIPAVFLSEPRGGITGSESLWEEGPYRIVPATELIEARMGAAPFVDVPNWAGFRDRTYVLLPPPLTAESSAPVLRPS